MHICRFCSLSEAQTSDHTRLGFFGEIWSCTNEDDICSGAGLRQRYSWMWSHWNAHAHTRTITRRTWGVCMRRFGRTGCSWELSFGRCYTEWAWETQLLCPCVHQCELFRVRLTLLPWSSFPGPSQKEYGTQIKTVYSWYSFNYHQKYTHITADNRKLSRKNMGLSGWFLYSFHSFHLRSQLANNLLIRSWLSWKTVVVCGWQQIFFFIKWVKIWDLVASSRASGQLLVYFTKWGKKIQDFFGKNKIWDPVANSWERDTSILEKILYF